MILNLTKDIETVENLPLYKHSTFKIGGLADIAIFPKNTDEFIAAVNALTESGTRFDIIGNASNILFDDKGYRGALVFTGKMNKTQYTRIDGGALVEVGCGKKLTELAGESLKSHSLAGLEFAYGIPGSVGGAVYMNAGAYGGEMSQTVVVSTCYNSSTKELFTLTAEQHNFSYRHSFFGDNKDCFVLSTIIKLCDDANGDAWSKAQANMKSRKEKQPLEHPNAGSTFKRPEGYIAAKLIDECGLKGLSVGGAQVSEKHAGFFVNKGGATSSDVLELADLVKQRVFDTYGVDLELEIIYIPEK